MIEGHQENHATGQGQAVNISIGLGGWLFAAVLVVLVAILLVMSTRALSKAEQAEAAAKQYAGELRMAQYWMQASYNACNVAGVKQPPIPAAFLKK